MLINDEMLLNAQLIVKTLQAQSLQIKGKLMAKTSQKQDLIAEIDELENLLDESDTQAKHWQGFINDNTIQIQKGGAEDDKPRA